MCESRTPQRPPWLHQPHQCIQWGTPRDTHGRNNNPESTSGSCAILNVGHVCNVAPHGRGDATGAVLATATHHFGNFVLGTLFRTASSLGIRMYLVEACPWIHKCLRARSQCLKENPWTTARCRIAPSGTSSSLIETSSCSLSSAVPQRWHSRGVWSLDTPRLGQRASKEPLDVISPGPCFAATGAACSSLKSRKVWTETPS